MIVSPASCKAQLINKVADNDVKCRVLKCITFHDMKYSVFLCVMFFSSRYEQVIDCVAKDK